MKKITLTFALCLALSGPCFAQNNEIEAMRFLTINELMQYGQQLYDRGDFNEASAVFNHILSFDVRQPQALQYLKKMGYSPNVSPVEPKQVQFIESPMVVQAQAPAESVTYEEQTARVLGKDIVVNSKEGNQIVSTDVSDTRNLQEAIEAKKQAIEKLKLQVKQMKENLTAQTN
jgi:hypothetical protein